MCEVLEGLFYGTLTNPAGRPFKRLIMNVPPRHGKTRTLVLFTAWALGKRNTERIIVCSYNDSEAQDFSKYTRNTIQEELQASEQIVYSSIFPETKIKKGDASFQKWALEGQFFSYKGAGIGGAITGKGGTIIIVDDPIKDAEVAYSELALEKIWKWYTGTLLSRREEGALEIINHTRWTKKDLCGRILDGPDADEWYVFQLEAYDKEKNKMLCESLLSQESYDYIYRNMDKMIFMANYHNICIDIEGSLYHNLKTYTRIPVDNNGNPLFEQIINYTDTADEGDCFLCSICAGVYQGHAYIIDVYYTKDGMEITEARTAKFLLDNYVSRAKIESNNGGRGFARNVKRILWDVYKTRRPIEWFHQHRNKMSRILTNSNWIMENVFFPVDWAIRWPEFFQSIVSFQKDGKNKYLDGPDALTGIAEMIDQGFKFHRYEAIGSV